jgi:hypothetical protein
MDILAMNTQEVKVIGGTRTAFVRIFEVTDSLVTFDSLIGNSSFNVRTLPLESDKKGKYFTYEYKKWYLTKFKWL